MALDPKWKTTIDKALSDSAWDDHDAIIKREVLAYFTRLNLKADPTIFKAQVWTESGAASPAWNTRPMQIGNPGDPGLATLKAGKENSRLIMSQQVRDDLKKGRSIDNPEFNIQLGLAYAFTKLSDFRSVVSDQKKLVYEVVSGDSVEAIAAKVGTTKQNILVLNPSAAKMIHPKQKLTYQKAAIKPVSITVTPGQLQIKYNGGGDPDYADKIKYCLDVIAKLKR